MDEFFVHDLLLVLMPKGIIMVPNTLEVNYYPLGMLHIILA
jgi:hypothetical protein